MGASRGSSGLAANCTKNCSIGGWISQEFCPQPIVDVTWRDMTRLKRVVRFYDKITEHDVTNGMRFSLFDQFFFVGDGESNLDKRVDKAIVIDLVGDRIEIRFYFCGFFIKILLILHFDGRQVAQKSH